MKIAKILDIIRGSGAADIDVQSILKYTTPKTDYEDDEIPNWAAVKSMSSEAYEVPFESVNGLVINWQTDLIPGTTQTYAEVLGNTLPKPRVYFLDADTYTDPGTTPTVSRPADDIILVTFAWGIAQTGIIVF